MENLGAYERCERCACYFANLEKRGVVIEEECSQGQPCYKKGFCPGFSKEKGE